jgi:hypothetical protein
MTKSIIAGLRYDTDTATLVARWSNMDDTGNFHFHWERLYRTPNGNWFTLGGGGALSPYARREPDGTRYGDRDVIRAINPAEALLWLEKHGETEAVEAYFADTIQDA